MINQGHWNSLQHMCLTNRNLRATQTWKDPFLGIIMVTAKNDAESLAKRTCHENQREHHGETKDTSKTIHLKVHEKKRQS